MSELRFDGLVAVVTGAGDGLGRAHARLLGARGARVVVNDVAADRADAVVTGIRSAGGEAVADTHTVATAEGGAAIVQAALDAFGRVDIVVNNAGILADGAFHNLTADMLGAVLDVHLRGAFHVTQPAWPHFRAQGHGRVVLTTSSAGLLGNFGQANYGAAKAGLVGLARVLAVEGARYDIKVNAVAPLARTSMTEVLLGSLGARLDPELVAPVVAWLCHQDCPVTGEVISAAGGRVGRWFVGLTPGWYDPDLTPEAVRDNWEVITSETGYTVPSAPADELAGLLARFATGS